MKCETQEICGLCLSVCIQMQTKLEVN